MNDVNKICQEWTAVSKTPYFSTLTFVERECSRSPNVCLDVWMKPFFKLRQGASLSHSVGWSVFKTKLAMKLDTRVTTKFWLITVSTTQIGVINTLNTPPSTPIPSLR